MMFEEAAEIVRELIDRKRATAAKAREGPSYESSRLPLADEAARLVREAEAIECVLKHAEEEHERVVTTTLA